MTKAEFKQAWLRHPETRDLQRKLEGRLDVAFKALLNRCRASTDPNVTSAFAHWESLSSALEHFSVPQEDEKD